MAFSSVTFLFFFLPLTLALYAFVGKRGRSAVFLVASLVFYLWGEGRGTAVLMLAILVNYVIGLAMISGGRPLLLNRFIPGSRPGDGEPRGATRTVLLTVGLVFNLGLLAFYKYTGFLLSTLSTLLPGLGLGPMGPAETVAPTGISFFTFHAISYLVDIHRGRSEPERSPTALAVYMAAFPKVLAGPIVPYHKSLEGLKAFPLSVASLASGIERFILGLGKKVLIASPLAGAADQVFDLPTECLTAELAWLGLVCYTLQIYFDFSGYTDMAIGLGKMFGCELPENFDFPYASQSIRDFWRRWHISLSQWLRDYLYIPLGGNRCSPIRHGVNLMIVFLLCGLWHGAQWTFVVWGLWHGIFLILERAPFGKAIEWSPRAVRHAYALLVVSLGWVFFRSASFSQALSTFQALAGFGEGVPSPVTPASLVDAELILALAVGILLSAPLLDSLKHMLPDTESHGAPGVATTVSVLHGLLLATVFVLACMALAGTTLQSFIYFRF